MVKTTLFERMSAIARMPRWVEIPEQLEAKVAPLPTIDGGWQTVVADPPWKFKVWADSEGNSHRVENHYETMTLEEIAAMPVKDVVADDSNLLLWTTGPYLTRAAEVMESWGFHYSGSGLVWIKFKRSLIADQFQFVTIEELNRILSTGTGYTTRKNAEFCLLGRRGHSPRLARDVHEVIISPAREHSRKPDEFYERVERLYGGPRLELFSRQTRAGWAAWGNETGKFAG